MSESSTCSSNSSELQGQTEASTAPASSFNAITTTSLNSLTGDSPCQSTATHPDAVVGQAESSEGTEFCPICLEALNNSNNDSKSTSTSASSSHSLPTSEPTIVVDDDNKFQSVRLGSSCFHLFHKICAIKFLCHKDRLPILCPVCRSDLELSLCLKILDPNVAAYIMIKNRLESSNESSGQGQNRGDRTGNSTSAGSRNNYSGSRNISRLESSNESLDQDQNRGNSTGNSSSAGSRNNFSRFRNISRYPIPFHSEDQEIRRRTSSICPRCLYPCGQRQSRHRHGFNYCTFCPRCRQFFLCDRCYRP